LPALAGAIAGIGWCCGVQHGSLATARRADANAMDLAASLTLDEIDLPARPDTLVRLSLLLAEDEVDLAAVGVLVENDMALAAAVLKAVNSPRYGLRTAMRSVRHAVNYLGLRETAGISYEAGLRAAFAPSAEVEAIWQRAARRGQIMGRLGQVLGVKPWVAHSAGLFEECGKAVLLQHVRDSYGAMLRACGDDDTELLSLENSRFGIAHDALGAALCEAWQLDGDAVACVRQHVAVRTSRQLPAQGIHGAVSALSAVAWALMHAPQELADVAAQVAPQALLDAGRVLEAVTRVRQSLPQPA